jgi:hypothetical protein
MGTCLMIQAAEIGDMLIGHNQQMAGREGVDIHECRHNIIVKYCACLHMSLDDLTKNTRWDTRHRLHPLLNSIA